MFPTGKTMVACLRVSWERVCTLVQFLLRLSFLGLLTTWLKSFWLRGKTLDVLERRRRRTRVAATAACAMPAL